MIHDSLLLYYFNHISLLFYLVNYWRIILETNKPKGFHLSSFSLNITGKYFDKDHQKVYANLHPDQGFHVLHTYI